MITHTMPVAVQRGKTTEVVVEGQMNFYGTYKAIFAGTGVQAEVEKPPSPPAPPATRPQVRTVKMKVTVEPDAALGVRDFRLAAGLGLSSVGQLVIVDEPVVVEAGDNNTPPKATPITAPSVAVGRMEALEDVDFFKFKAEAGQTFTFQVLCARLQDRIHDLQKHADPIVTLYDADGRELAANDDFAFADPLLTYTVPKAGDYFVQVRDSKYDGDPRWVYALMVTNRPFVSHVFPMAGNPGQGLEVEPVGSLKAVKPRAKLQVPSQPGLCQVQLDLDGGKSNPTPFLVSTLPQVLETEPNDTPEQATRVTLPCGINGRLGKPRDLDYYVFNASKGKPVRFEVKARRFGTLLRSSLDSFIEITNRKGAVLASNDDTNGKDAAVVFNPPADEEYVLCVRDLNSKGGDTAIYHVEADWALPDFTVRCDPDKAMIGPGSSTGWYVHVARVNGFDGPVAVEVKGLPKGVTASPLTIPPTMTQGLIVLTAAADAPVDAVNVQILGTGTVKVGGGKEPARTETLVRTATPNQEIYFPGGGRGRFDVDLQTVAVTEPSDILKVDVSTQKIVLKPGQEARIEVTLERRKDYDKSVSLDIPLQHLGTVFGNPLPPGVTIEAGKSKTLLGSASKGHIVIKAAANAAPIEEVPISVLCHVSINFVVKVSYSSPPIMVSVQK